MIHVYECKFILFWVLYIFIWLAIYYICVCLLIKIDGENCYQSVKMERKKIVKMYNNSDVLFFSCSGKNILCKENEKQKKNNQFFNYSTTFLVLLLTAEKFDEFIGCKE